jgi:uncharacterized phage-associated protein
VKRAADFIPFILTEMEAQHAGSVTPLKLQKIIYYAQAWSLVFRNKGLFSDDFEAWIHGPAIPEIYQAYKHYGWNAIPRPKTVIPIENEEQSVISSVLEAYGAMTGKALEELTHSESPWLNARVGLNSNRRSHNRISKKAMKAYYQQFVESYNPIRIAQVATSTEKKHTARSSCKNVLHGIGSVLPIFPIAYGHSSSPTHIPIRSSSDAEAIASDWNRVGSDLWHASQSIKRDNT